MTPHKRLFIISGALVFLALISTVLVWLLLQDTFVQQEKQKADIEETLQAPSVVPVE